MATSRARAGHARTKRAGVASRALAALLKKDGIEIARQMVGNYVTSLEMPGVSVTLMRADDELLELFDAPVNTVAWK